MVNTSCGSDTSYSSTAGVLARAPHVLHIFIIASLGSQGAYTQVSTTTAASIPATAMFTAALPKPPAYVVVRTLEAHKSVVPDGTPMIHRRHRRGFNFFFSRQRQGPSVSHGVCATQ